MSLMEMDRTSVENVEETWIAKYRSAATVPSIQQSRVMKVREAVTTAYKIVILRVRGILSRWTQPRMQRATPPQPMLVPEPQTVTREMNQVATNQSAVKQATLKQAESSGAHRPRKRRQQRQGQEPPRSTTKYRAG
jgi:hypothetical protein